MGQKLPSYTVKSANSGSCLLIQKVPLLANNIKLWDSSSDSENVSL